MNISIDKLEFVFHQKKGIDIPVLSSFSLEIESGKTVAIIGPSGCGKSTILRLIGGLLEATQGTINIEGKTPEERRKEGVFGLVFQNPALLPWRSIEQNIKLPLELRRGRNNTYSEVQNVLKEVGLESWGKKYPHQLSGGMQQRVALARALVAKPKILLLDEPFSQLDELLRYELLFQIQNYSITNQATTILVTHDISEAVLASDLIFVLSSRPVIKAKRIEILLPKPRSLSVTEMPLFHQLVANVRSTLQKLRIKT